jgi:hypothetical protein
MTVLFCGSEPEDFAGGETWNTPGVAITAGGSADPAYYRTGTVRYAVSGPRSFTLPYTYPGGSYLHLVFSVTFTDATPGFAGKPLVIFSNGSDARHALILYDNTFPARLIWAKAYPPGTGQGEGGNWLYQGIAGIDTQTTFQSGTRYRLSLSISYDPTLAFDTIYSWGVWNEGTRLISPSYFVNGGTTDYVAGLGHNKITLNNAAGALFSEVICATSNMANEYLIALPPTGAAGTIEVEGEGARDVRNLDWTGSWSDLNETVLDTATLMSAAGQGSGTAGQLTDLPAVTYVVPGQTGQMWAVHAIKQVVVGKSSVAVPAGSIGLRNNLESEYSAQSWWQPAAFPTGFYAPLARYDETNSWGGGDLTQRLINGFDFLLRSDT